MTAPLRIAAVQMTSQENKARNVETAVRWVREAHSLGASFVGLPENVAWMGPEEARGEAAEPLDGPTSSRFAELARELSVTLLAGSVLETGGPAGRLYNTSVLYGPDGARLALYRKMHLFDVDAADGASYRESDAVAPGDVISVAQTVLGKVGLSICYDVRFPELYRAQSREGAVMLTVPSAFTLMTGKDHWEVLLRARAIENQAYVLAPAQVGQNGKGRATFGNALVVDPWGLVTARASEGEGLAVATFDPELISRIRGRLPALLHRRM